MLKYLKQLFMFLAPIFKTAAIQVAADELNKKAYPTRRPGFRTYERPRASYAQKPRSYTDKVDPSYEEARTGKFRPDANYETARAAKQYHDVVMVAFDIAGPNALLVQSVLEGLMPATGNHNEGVGIDAWWIADDVVGNSDCDSAVFVKPGKQREARQLLRDHGLASS